MRTELLLCWVRGVTALAIAVTLALPQVAVAAPAPPPPPPKATPAKPEPAKKDPTEPGGTPPGKDPAATPAEPGAAPEPAPGDQPAAPVQELDPQALAAEDARTKAEANLRAYNKVKRKKKGGKKGTKFFEGAVAGYQEAFRNDPSDRNSLEAALTLLERHLWQLEANKSKRYIGGYQTKLQWVKQKLEELDQAEVEAARLAKEEAAKAKAEKDGVVEPEVVAPPPPPSDVPTKLKWGYRRPVARWKWAGFGLTLTLATGGLLLGIIGRSRSKPGGPLEVEAFTLANASLTDLDDFNDVDPRLPGNICVQATDPRMDMPTLLKNPAIADVCNQASTWETVSIVGYAGMGAALVGLVVFTTLLFVHRDQGGKRARLRPEPDGLTVRF